MAHKWKVKRGQKEHGPLSSEQLRNLARTGKLKPSDLVRRGETSDWKEASSVAGLLSQSGAAGETATAAAAVEETTPSQSDSLGFIDWYKTKWMSQQPALAQAALWLFYGWLWIPAWYMTTARTGNIFVKVAVGAILLALFLPAIKNAREAARRSQERANATLQSPSHTSTTQTSKANQSGKWGLIGLDGRFVEPCIHDHELKAYETTETESESSKWWKTIAELNEKYSDLGARHHAFDPDSQISLVQAINGEWSFVDGNEQVVARLPKSYQFFDNTFDENGWTKFTLSGKPGWGMVDTSGRVTVRPQYYWLSPFTDGLAAAERLPLSTFDPTLPVAKMGFIDTHEQWVIKPQWNSARPFSEGLAAVEDGKSKKWGFIDRSGAIVIECKFEDVYTFSHTGTQAGAFAQGLAPVRVGDKWGYINKNGSVVIPPTFTKAHRFDNGFAAVQW